MSNGNPQGGSAAGSSGAAPSSSPASTPSSTPSGGDSGSGDSYSFMNEVFGSSSEAPAAPPSRAEPTPGAEPQPAPPTTPEPQPTPAPEPAPAAPPASPADPAQIPASSQQGSPPTAAETRFDPADPISLARGLDDNREAAIEHLAQTVFRLEPNELEALETDVAGTVPKLLAKAVVYAQTQFLTQLSRVVPLMIQRQAQVGERHQANLNEFYSAWPSLDRGKHGPAVQELAVRYRQMYPTATKEQMIEHIGPMLLSQLGLPMTPMHRGPAARPANGGQPARGSPKPAGFVPAAPGTVSQVTTVPEDPWAFMGPDQG